MLSGASRNVRITCLPTSVAYVADKSRFSSFLARCGPRALKTAAWVAAAFKEGVYHLSSYEHLFRGWIPGRAKVDAPPGNFEKSFVYKKRYIQILGILGGFDLGLFEG